MAPVRTIPRWVSAVEVAGFYALAHGIIWWGDRFRPTIILVALIMVALCVGSNIMHGDSRERIGLDFRNFWPCLRLVALVTLPFLIPLLWIGAGKRFYWPWDLPWMIVGYPLWGFAQEYTLLAFVNNRLEDALAGHGALVPWINALLFSLAHLPNPVLMLATFIAGYAFTAIFRRHRNLVPIALAHAAVGVAISLAFADLSGVMSVGPGYGVRVGRPVAF